MSKRISPSETLALRERITKATRNGRLQEWNERIGEIASFAGMNLGSINWNDAPEHVARAIVEYANQRSAIDGLEAAIATYESKYQS